MLFFIFRSIFATLLISPLLFAWAGGLRFYFGTSLAFGIFCSFPIFAIFLWKELHTIALKSFAQIILCLSIFTYFLIRLYSPDLGTLVSYGCADAANHLGLYRHFLAENITAYNGFNALYVNWWLFEHIFSLNVLTALTLALTIPVFCVSYLIAFISPALSLKRIEIVRFLSFIVATIVLSEFCILPLLHYNQADGYLAHLYSITPYLIAILFGESLSYLALASLLVACRFTYSLQLPDLLACASFVFALRATKAQVSLRKLSYALISTLLLVATWLGLTKLTEVFSLSGSIISQNLDFAFAAQIAGIALILACRMKNSFEIWFLVSISAIQGFWLITTHESDYYFSKLFLYSSLLLTIVALRELPSLLKSNVILRSVSWIILVSFLIIAQRPYIPSYTERSLATTNYHLIAPLLDPKVKEIIDEVLISENKSLFRYYTSRWAQYSFFNNLYNLEGDFESFSSPATNLDKNSCIFWSSNSNDIPRLEKYPAPLAVEWLNNMNQRKDAKVVKYQVNWAGKQVIKYICSGDEALTLK